MKDWRGIEIRVGSHVVYATTQSSNISLVEAVVVDFEPWPEDRWHPKEWPVRPVVERIDGWYYYGAMKTPRKRVKLQRPDRVTVVPPRPVEIKRDYDLNPLASFSTHNRGQQS